MSGLVRSGGWRGALVRKIVLAALGALIAGLVNASPTGAEEAAAEPPTTVATENPIAESVADGKPPGFSARTFAALSNTNFRLIFLGNLFQFASMQMMGLVQGVLVFQLTGSFAALGIVSLANAIPGLMFYPAAAWSRTASRRRSCCRRGSYSPRSRRPCSRCSRRPGCCASST